MKTKITIILISLFLLTGMNILANDNKDEVIYRVPEYVVNNIQDIETLSETKPGFLRERGDYERFKRLSGNGKGIKVGIVDTGLDTMTGGRIKRLKDYIGEDDFLLTYGDGVADVDIAATIDLHNKCDKLVTMTAVRPVARFGELDINNNAVESFEEKPQLHQGWINGGFFVCHPNIINYIDGDHEMFEREPLQRIVKDKGMAAYKHEGFWQCMDSKRDYEKLNEIWNAGLAPWA